MEERLLGSEAKDISDLKGRIWIENKKIWKVGFPAALARVTQYGMFVVTQSFIGHAGKLQLAGMSSATETLCGQAFGARQYHMMGVYLQRSWIINLLTATILLPVFIFSGKIFRLLGEEEETASAAGYISLWFIPMLYFFSLAFSLQKYLQTQLKNMIVGWLSAASFALHVLLSWIFVSKLNWGIPGAMIAMNISSWLVIIGELVYVVGGWCPDTWRGFTLAAFTDLIPVIKLSISSGLMLCLEFWYNAVLVLLAGYMKNATTQVSALSICLNITAWEFMLCIAFLTSASVRVSNELGRGDAKAAKFSVKVILFISLCLGAFFFIICLAFDSQIAKLFTNEQMVIKAVSNLSLLLAFSVLLNSFQAVLTGVAVGAGRQSMVACINVSSYYIGGVPIGVILGYVAHLQIKGIWIGMTIGVVMQVMVLGYVTSRTNWDEQVKKASERLNSWFLRPSEESNNENFIRESLNG
ncbi:protein DETOXIFICATION 24 isoform X2 [Hevea brasiliensis]|uniref:protein DETOXIFICATION 24 isoform X2 n=1 Tax=Hevea brasiliensis TaxID=3981 RepID=UPI0025E9310E|nr:protein DETOXIFICATION 24 isoform X2 [Hevea brasiliensis]